MAVINAYLDLITSQHRVREKFMRTVAALLTPSDDIFALAIYLDDAFDLDYATGAQEDILGEFVGARRTLPYQPDKGLSPVLDNAAYRNLLRAQIAKNQWKGGIEDIKELWDALFGKGILIQDNQDMTINVLVIGISDQITKEMVRQGLIVPKPQGVRMNYYFADRAVFGYDLETDTIKGYDHADWMNSLPSVSFSYDTADKNAGMNGYDESRWT
jgi:possible bacteriophage protein